MNPQTQSKDSPVSPIRKQKGGGHPPPDIYILMVTRFLTTATILTIVCVCSSIERLRVLHQRTTIMH